MRKVSGIEHNGFRRGSWQKGCLIAFVVVFILIVAAVATLWVTRKRLVAAGINAMTTAMVDQSTLAPDQKTRIKDKVAHLANDYRDGKITNEQFMNTVHAVVEGPFLPLSLIRAADGLYITKSGLTPEEKAQAKVEIARFSRGVADEKLQIEDVRSVIAYISTSHGPNAFELKKSVTDAELRKFIEEMKTKADKVAVPADVAEFDIATELEKAIDKGLSTQTLPPAQPAAPVEKPADGK